MSRISGSIPTLINGVSQQAAALRLPTQAEEQVNCYGTVVSGLSKRPPTHWLSKISNSIGSNVFTHIINRDITERYVVTIDNDTPETPNILTSDQAKIRGWTSLSALQEPQPEGAPDILNDSIKVTFDGTTGAFISLLPEITPVADAAHTFSIWLKLLSGTLADADNVIEISGPNLTADQQVSINSLTEGEWLKLEVTGNSIPSPTASNLTIKLACDDEAVLEVYGAQLEASSYATLTAVEDGNDDWTGVLSDDEYAITGWSVANGAGQSTVSNGAPNGEDSVQVVYNGTAGGAINLTPSGFTPDASSEYTFSLWLKLTSGSLSDPDNSLQIYGTNISGTPTSQSVNSVTLGQWMWVKVTGLTISSPTLDNLSLQLLCDDTATFEIFGAELRPAEVDVIPSRPKLHVFDFQGGEVQTWIPNSNGYLDASNPKAQYKATTVADYTFIVNSQKTVLKTEDKSPDYDPQALFTVLQGQYGATYAISIDGVTQATYQTPDGSNSAHTQNITVTNIATELYNDLVANGFNTGDWSLALNSGTIGLRNIAGDEFIISVKDPVGDGQGLLEVKDKIQSFTDLPFRGIEDFHVEISGDDVDGFTKYYVRYEDASNNIWIEDIKEDIHTRLDSSTMPHVLVRQSNGTFTFNEQVWNDREVGDDNSNPFPSFIDRQIKSVFFTKNRLGFLADENAILSAAGDYFRFFRTTATALLDDDPIDIAATHVKVSLLNDAVPFKEELVVFSDQTQFRLKSQDILTSKTVSFNPSTEFESSNKATPAAAGASVYFAVEKTDFAAIREYYVDTNVGDPDSRDLTEHIPKYIPAGVDRIVVSTAEDVLVCSTPLDPSGLFIYKWFRNEDGQKLQNSWSRWELPDVVNVLGFEFIQSTLHIVLERGDGIHNETISFDQAGLSDEGLSWLNRLDQKISADHADVTSSYNAGTDETTFTFPFTFKSVPRVIGGAGGSVVLPGEVVEIVGSPTTYDSNQVVLSGDLTSEPLFFGIPYDSLYDLSTIYVRSQKSNGSVTVVTEGRLALQTLSFQYSESGYFSVEVAPEGRDPYRYQMNARELASVSLVTGSQPIVSGEFRTPIMAQNDKVKISVKSDSHLPFTLTSAEWTGIFSIKTKRI